ncbi:MAG TPA: hypothetical protein VHW96_07630 [Solirubrobacteraceae bacterium]|nr:hypothetical protein [Solirubrobacteraceae bacterium]
MYAHAEQKPEDQARQLGPAVAEAPAAPLTGPSTLARSAGRQGGPAPGPPLIGPPCNPDTLVRGARLLARAVSERRQARESRPPRRRLARIFERPDAQKDAAGAKAAVQEFAKLSSGAQDAELNGRYPSGDLSKSLHRLPVTARLDPDIAGTMLTILNWIEGYEARQATGKTDAELAQLQADVLKAEAKKKKKPPPNWGGVAATATRFAALGTADQAAWTARGKASIKKMATFCAANNPELGVTEATFELDFSGVDQVSLGAIATGGSQAGKTVQVGFEFVVAVEMNERYALSTVVHELYGHPGYDPAGRLSYQQSLYQKAVKLTPKGTVKDRRGDQTYGYWPSEIYSLLKEVSYFTPVSGGDAKITVNLPGGQTTTMDKINYDPAGMVEDWLKSMRARWNATVLPGLLRGFYKRLYMDPSQSGKAMSAFVKAVTNVFGSSAASDMTK